MTKISDAELEVLKVLWEKKQANSFDIIEALKENNWNDNTVRTLIKRLQDKKAIKIISKEGKTYTYTACINENEYKLEESKNFLNKLYNGSINEMLVCFAKQEKLSKEELKKLLDEIEED